MDRMIDDVTDVERAEIMREVSKFKLLIESNKDMFRDRDMDELLELKEKELFYCIKIDRILRPQYEYLNSLSQKEKDAIKDYTNYFYIDVNQYLRTGNEKYNTKVVQNSLAIFKKIYDEIPPLSETIVVYRGQREEDFNTKSVTSTTTNIMIPFKEFTSRDCCFYKITVLPGTKVIPVRHISVQPGEYEIIIDREVPFMITYASMVEQETSYKKLTIKTIQMTIQPKKVYMANNEKQINGVVQKLEVEKIVDLVHRRVEMQGDDIDEDDLEMLIKSVSKYIKNAPSIEEIKTAYYNKYKM